MIRFIRSHQNLIKMKNDKDFEKWRADTIGYVFFSRLNNLIIKETGKDNPYFDYVIDIGDNHRRQTGHVFGVTIRAFQEDNLSTKTVLQPYKNVPIPILNVFFDTYKDVGFYNWIKKPTEKGDLQLGKSEDTVEPLTTESIKNIVQIIEHWYQQNKQTAKAKKSMSVLAFL